MDDACQLCAQCSQHWRAASLGGAGLWGPMPLGELKQLSFDLVLQRLQDTLHGAPSAQHAGLQRQPGIKSSLPSNLVQGLGLMAVCTEGICAHGCLHMTAWQSVSFVGIEQSVRLMPANCNIPS